MISAFRFRPPQPRAEWIDRPRLIEQLGRRFELDVMLVTAPAGYGKTTVLAQLLSLPSDADRVDVWLQCDAGDTDDESLARALVEALGVPFESGSDLSRAVVDALVRFAPSQICVVIDDVHVLTSGSGGLALLTRIVEQLPGNAHLVLCGRANPGVPLGRLLAHGLAERFGADDLAYDDDELDRVALAGSHRAGNDASPSESMRWPASARLSHGGEESVTELLLEIANGLAFGDRAALTALSNLPSVDDDLVDVATSGARTADALLGALPLVQRSDDQSFQMHDLWRRSLNEDSAVDADARSAINRLADRLVELGRHVQAAELFAAAGATDGVERAGRHLLEQPLMRTSAPALRAMAKLSRQVLGDHPVTELLAATIAESSDERDSAARFEAVAAAAEAAGDIGIEALAVQNAMNMRSIVDPSTIGDDLLDRADRLAAAGNEMAQSCAFVIRSHRARLAGEPEVAVGHLKQLVGVLAPMMTGSLAFGLSDLGRPEEIPTPTDVGQAATDASQAGGQALAQALWLRGDVSPELALELGAHLAGTADEGGVPNQAVSTNAVLALVACAAGDDRAARRFVDQANRWSVRTASPHVRGLAAVADAALSVCDGDRTGAAATLRDLLSVLPIGAWPERPYLYSLPMLYVLVPETRTVIDGCRFGSAYTTVQEAAQAIVALVDHDDPGPAAALDWQRVELLRAHVLPPHLALLVAAASASGNAEVGGIVEQIPSLRRHLAAAVELGHGGSATWARATMAGLPQRPTYDLRVDLLGPATLWRGTTKVVDPDWTNRDRVRQMLALVVTHRRLPRRRAAELLWPDLPMERALSNLRVNLSHLQRVLQPGRRPDERPWFLAVDNDMLSLAVGGVTQDVGEFERLAAQARSYDDAGRITAALDEYRRAAQLYRGDFAEEWVDCEWAAVEQRRLRALALAVLTRLAELLLARGDPEAACETASRALRFEPLHEPAARCFAKALAGQGDRAGAMRALRALLDRCEADGLRCERETLRLAASFGLGESRTVGEPGPGERSVVAADPERVVEIERQDQGAQAQVE